MAPQGCNTSCLQSKPLTMRYLTVPSFIMSVFTVNNKNVPTITLKYCPSIITQAWRLWKIIVVFFTIISQKTGNETLKPAYPFMFL